MTGQLAQNIIALFKIKFENNCIALLLDGYNSLKSSMLSIREQTENNITAQLVGLMKINPNRYDLQISIERENHIDGEAIYTGLEDADKSARIDIKYTTWNSNVEYEYHIEAKNIAETDWQKNSDNVQVNALKLQKRYIKTGIDNFASGRYYNGCLVGYVLEGSIENIVDKINLLLKNENKEQLSRSLAYGADVCHYISQQPGINPTVLKHFFLLFSLANQ